MDASLGKDYPNEPERRCERLNSDPHFLETKRLFPIDKQHILETIDAYRREYELLHGPTDTSRRYTTELPAEEQARLGRDDTERYIAGWPDFGRAYAQELLQRFAADGNLDDVPDNYLQVFVRNRGRLPSFRGS